MASFDSCAVSTKSTGKLPMPEIRDVARQYERRGMAPEAALLRSLEDQLEMAQMAERQIVQAVRGAYAARGGRPRPAEPAPAARYSVSDDITESPAFRAWFGSSNNVDEQGRPKVWFRGQIGAKADQDPFSATALGAPSFADTPDIANIYATNPDAAGLYGMRGSPDGAADGGNVGAFYVNGQVLDIRSLQGGHGTRTGLTPKAVRAVLKKLGLTEEQVDLYGAYAGKYGSGSSAIWDVAEEDVADSRKLLAAYVLADDPAVQEALREKGYSALVFDGTVSDPSAGNISVPWHEAKVHGELRVVEPRAIKSAIGNNGEFSPDNPDIRYSAAETLADVRAAWDGAGIKNFISERNGIISLSQIIVPESGRGAGAGTQAMQQLVEYADRTGQRIVLTPSADFGGSKSRLIPFYKRFGFVENKGRNKDYEVSEAMYRDPQNARASVATMPEARAPLAAISPLIQKLADGGAVVVHADASTLPGGRAPAGVQALTERDGTIHLVASSLTDANARAVLLHEAFHAGAEKLVGTEQWNKLMQRLESLQKLAQSGRGAARDFFDRAAQRVASAKARGAVAAGMETEEFGAYAIEEYESAPPSIRKWVNDFLGLVKAWALARFGAQLGDVTPAQLSGLARLALLDVRAERMQRAQPAFSDRRADERDTPDRRIHTIQFEGQRRPIENSRGQVLAEDMNKQLAFYRWFKDSKVVDEQQRPLVVYHGTGSDFTVFDENVDGAHWKMPGLYFAPDPADASRFAEASAKVSEMKQGRPFAPNGANVMPVYLSLQNPKVIEFGKRGSAGFIAPNEMADMIREAKFDGHDGAIIKGWQDGSGEVQYVAFSPEQIKSAVGNAGTFSPDTADIRYSVAGAPSPRPTATWTAPEATRIDQIVHTLQDKFIDMKRVVQAIRKTSGDIGDKFDPYLQEELFHGRSATGFKSFLDGELRPLLEDLQMRGEKLADFEQFLVMRHAEETNIQIAKINPEMPDGGSGVMTADARAYLANLPAGKRAAYQALAARVDAMVKGTQQTLLDYGLEKQETIDAWNGAYKHYVPMHREDMENMLQGAGTGQGFSIRGSSAKRRVGSDKGVVNVLANLAQARERAIVRGEKNRLLLALYGLALKAPNILFWKPINPKKNPAALQAELVNMGLPAALVQNFIDEPQQKTVATIQGQDTVVRRVNTMLRSAPNVVAVRVAGEDRFIFFNERDERALRMAQSLKNLTGGELNRFLELIGKGTRWFASVNTQYNPIFGVVNLLRDAQGVALNLTSTPLNGKQAQVEKELARMLWKAGRQWFRLDSLKGADAALWQEFQREGGITGYRAMFAGGDERHAELEAELRRMSEGKFKKAGRAVFDWLSDYNEALENVTRMAAYKVAKEQGLTPAQAASLAKNITTNFNRKGNISSQVGALYAFFNAAVQGTTRIAQTLDPRTTSGKAIIGGGLLLGTIQAVLLAAAGFEDDEPPEFIQAKNLVIPNPFSDAKDYVTIPMPLGFNVLPTISRIATQFMLSGGKRPAKRITDLMGAVLDSFNPIGHAGFSMQTILPTVVDPLAALEANRDYTGKKIYNEDINTTSPTPGHTRARAGASIPAKLAAEGINAVLGGNDYVPGVWSPTPEHLEYLTGQLTGGVGREILKGFQTGQALATGEELAAHRIPLAGRFYGTTEDGANVRARFMDNLVQLNLLKQEYEGRAEDKAGATEFKAANPILTMADEAQAVQREVSKLNKEKRRLMEAGAPRDKVTLMDEKIRTRMEKFNAKVLERREKLEAAE